MRVIQSLLLTFCVQLSAGLSLPVKKGDLLKRQQSDVSEDEELGCINMKSRAGDYYHVSDGSGGVCGMYVIAQPDSLVTIEFQEFSVTCADGGLMALVDGWELQEEFFPNIDDTGDTFDARYKTFCGEQRPNQVYIASQNVALIQYRIPTAGQGFRVRITFQNNPQPCNVMAMPGAGVMTIKNYGARRNCTASIIYPENILLHNVDIGVTYEGAAVETEGGLSVMCNNDAGGDYVELLAGNGLDTAYMGRRVAFCGLRSKAARRHITMGCQNTAVRMVSSGLYYNTITFAVTKPSPEDLAAFNSDVC